jgi:hypothetical protein
MKMNRITLLTIIFITTLAVTAQETPSIGFMFPRLSTSQRLALPTTIAKGIQIFDTDTNSNWFYNGNTWVQNATAAMASKWTNNAGKVCLTSQSNGTTARTASNRLELSDAGNLYIGGSLVPTNGTIELGLENATGGDRNSYLDFHSKDGTDFDARLIRSPGINGSLSLVNQGTGGMFLGNNTANQLVINASGNVGIGRTIATSKLSVEGGILATDNNPITAQGAHLQWNRMALGETWLINQRGLGAGVSGIRFGESTQTDVVTEWARFQQNGNFGINTSNPTSKLTVVGLPIYANNAAALAAGQVVGAFYHVGDGILRVVY